MSDRTTGDNEIEITPEMIEAGEVALSEYNTYFDSRDEAVCRIFRQMVSARRTSSAH